MHVSNGSWTYGLTLHLAFAIRRGFEPESIEILHECYDGSVYEEGKIPLTQKTLNQKYKERMCKIIAKHTQSTSLRI